MSNPEANPNISASISNSTKILRNYNGELLKPGEKLVPIIQNDLFIKENVTNPESITYVGFGGKMIKAVLTAIPESAAIEAKSQNNYTLNDILGHYWYNGCVSLDEIKDEFDLDIETTPSVEDSYFESDALSIMKELIQPLLKKSPKHAFAYLLKATGISGKDFEVAMKLGHDAANTVRREAEHILNDGIANYDIDKLKANHSKHEDYYLHAAYDILERLMDLI